MGIGPGKDLRVSTHRRKNFRMIYDRWMDFVPDGVRLVDLCVPSAHNAGSYGMKKSVRCQDGGLYRQFLYGMRHFALRLDTTQKGEIVLCHGITKGDLLENALKDLRRALDSNSSEMFVIDIREYAPRRVIGRLNVRFCADPARVEALLDEYLEPEKNAFFGFDGIGSVTLGDMRRAGKRCIFANLGLDSKYGADCPGLSPWNRIIDRAPDRDSLRPNVGFFDSFEAEGEFWFRTRQTSRPFPSKGRKRSRSPRDADKAFRPQYDMLIESLADNAEYLRRANILSGDFMTENYSKSRAILLLNVLKGNVDPARVGEFVRGLWNAEPQSADGDSARI